MLGLASASKTYRSAYVSGLEPDPDVSVSEWAEKNRYLPAETTSYPGRWKNDRAPYMVEIMDCLSPTHPCDRVSFIKSAQIAGSEGIMNYLGFIIDIAPGPAMLVHPNVLAAKAWVQEKLNPNIEDNAALSEKVVEYKSREGGSTALFKKFPGGFLVITGANSAAALRQKSIRYLIKDDWDEWPLDIGGQGDPDKMANARQIGFHDSGTAKCFEVSTPTVKSVSRVTRAYEESDQRIFKVRCPHCEEAQELRFFPLKNDKERFRGGLKFNTTKPVMAHYVCEHNGCIIEHHEKHKLLSSGFWERQNPEPGRHPGFKINALYSPFTTWDKMAETFLAAKDKPRELKTFYNLWLGEAWEERGEAPDWKRLLSLREDYPLGRIPNGALIITTAVDVQKDGFYYEVVGWGIGKTSWVIDIGFIEGNTDNPASWKYLDTLYTRRYENAWGQAFPSDAVAVDSGYNTHRVYEWVRKKSRAIAVKGKPGAQAPIIGMPSKVDINYAGRRVKNGMRIFPVGTWMAKSELFSNLRLEGLKEGAPSDPFGYCHFSSGCDEHYFKQLTSESLITHMRNGREVTEWVKTGENHFLDCRVYNMAAAEWVGISRFTQAKWKALADLRNVPQESLQGDLLSLDAQLASTPAPSETTTKPARIPQSGATDKPKRKPKKTIRVKPR